MLRIHFTDVDLARTWLAPAPDPLFEIAASMHRLQSGLPGRLCLGRGGAGRVPRAAVVWAAVALLGATWCAAWCQVVLLWCHPWLLRVLLRCHLGWRGCDVAGQRVF